MSNSHRYCTQCGHGVIKSVWDEANFCPQCGDSLHHPIAPHQRITGPEAGVYTPCRIPPTSTQAAWQERAIAGGQFARDNPSFTAVAASGMGAAGLLLGPLIIAAGKMGLIAGGAAIVAGVLLDSDSDIRDNAFVRAGAKLIGGSVLAAGSGYLITAAGGIALATGVGIGATQAAKGTKRMIETRRKGKQQKSIEAMKRLDETGENA